MERRGERGGWREEVGGVSGGGWKGWVEGGGGRGEWRKVVGGVSGGRRWEG